MFLNSTAVVRIGRGHYGWIDEPRVTKGEARHADAWASRANNPRVTCHYEDSRHGSALTGVTDEEGDRVATWSCDSLLATGTPMHNCNILAVALVSPPCHANLAYIFPATFIM